MLACIVFALLAGWAKAAPRVFKYDLHSNYTYCRPGWSANLYGAEQAIPEAFNLSSYLVTDPNAADLFLVPAVMYCLTDGKVINFTERGVHRGAFHQIAWKVLEMVREQPWFDRHQGRDHLWTFTYDNGFCGFAGGEGAPEVLQHSIILSHWGMTVPEDRCSVHDWIHSYERCRHLPKYPVAAGALPCHVPEKDVVIPTAAYDELVQEWPAPLAQFQDDFLSSDLPTPSALSIFVPRNIFLPPLPARKRTLFFFVGDTRPHMHQYSHGVRQAVMLLNTTPGFEVVHTEYRAALPPQDMLAHAHASLFCLAATGTGFGVRFKQAAISGCIPVLINDLVRFEFEDVLPTADFAFRVPQHMIYHLPEILEDLVAKEPERLEMMVKRQACVANLLSWSPKAGGRALDVLMCALSGRGLTRRTTKALVNWELCKVTCELGPQHLT